MRSGSARSLAAVAAVAAVVAGLAVAAPAHALRGNDVICTMHADVQLDRATGAYTMTGIASPCEPVMWQDFPRTESGTISSAGTLSGDPCGSATWTGTLSSDFRWRSGVSDVPYAASSTSGLMTFTAIRGTNRVRAALALVPRSGTCDATEASFLAAGEYIGDSYSALWALP